MTTDFGVFEEANSRSAGLRTSWNQKLCSPVYKGPPLVRILSHINPIHSLNSYTHKNRHIIHPRSSRFQTKILYAFLIFLMRPTCPAHLIPHIHHTFLTLTLDRGEWVAPAALLYL